MQGQIVLSLVILQKARYAALLARLRERGAKAVKHHTSLGRRVFRGLGAARCPITLGADQSIFGATRRGPMRAPIARLDVASISEQVGEINAALRGHYAYYGVAGNLRSLVKVYRVVERYWRRME